MDSPIALKCWLCGGPYIDTVEIAVALDTSLRLLVAVLHAEMIKIPSLAILLVGYGPQSLHAHTVSMPSTPYPVIAPPPSQWSGSRLMDGSWIVVDAFRDHIGEAAIHIILEVRLLFLDRCFPLEVLTKILTFGTEEEFRFVVNSRTKRVITKTHPYLLTCRSFLNAAEKSPEIWSHYSLEYYSPYKAGMAPPHIHPWPSEVTKPGLPVLALWLKRAGVFPLNVRFDDRSVHNTYFDILFAKRMQWSSASFKRMAISDHLDQDLEPSPSLDLTALTALDLLDCLPETEEEVIEVLTSAPLLRTLRIERGRELKPLLNVLTVVGDNNAPEHAGQLKHLSLVQCLLHPLVLPLVFNAREPLVLSVEDCHNAESRKRVDYLSMGRLPDVLQVLQVVTA